MTSTLGYQRLNLVTIKDHSAQMFNFRIVIQLPPCCISFISSGVPALPPLLIDTPAPNLQSTHLSSPAINSSSAVSVVVTHIQSSTRLQTDSTQLVLVPAHYTWLTHTHTCIYSDCIRFYAVISIFLVG